MENSADQENRQAGFDIYRKGLVRRMSPTQYLVKSAQDGGSFLVEMKNGQWGCDCSATLSECEHRFASQLALTSTSPISDKNEESKLLCRYCGSPDIGKCGFRYNAYGISKRYRCNQCLRKFSIKYAAGQSNRLPAETIWLLSEIGMVLTKLEDLIQRIGSTSSKES